MAVSFADEGGVEVLSIEIDEAQEPAVGVLRIPGTIPDELHRLSFQPGLGESGRLGPEILHRAGGMHGFRRIDSDEPDGVALVLIANHQRISVNHPFDPGRDWPAAPLPRWTIVAIASIPAKHIITPARPARFFRKRLSVVITVLPLAMWGAETGTQRACSASAVCPRHSRRHAALLRRTAFRPAASCE